MAGSRPKAGGSRTDAVSGSGRGQILSAITSVVEAEIVPRLLAAHEARQRASKMPAPPLETATLKTASLEKAQLQTRPLRTGPLETDQTDGVASPASVVQSGAIDQMFVAAFAAELIASNRVAVEARIDHLGRDGMSAEDICLLALAPTARYLGDLWLQDLCSFIDVTSGTALLHAMMNELRPVFTSKAVSISRRRTAMLVTAPGEQHRFGLSMLAEFFRKEGWQVALPPATTTAQIINFGAARPIDVVGFSAGTDRNLGGLAACIAALRASACNPDLVVMVGGPIFLERPELVKAVGADGTADDAEQAVHRAFALLKAKRAAVTKRIAHARADRASSARSRTRAGAPGAADKQNQSRAPQ